MNKPKLTTVAASLAKGDALDELRTVCESQKSISSSRLEVLLDLAEEKLKRHAIEIKKVIDQKT